MAFALSTNLPIKPSILRYVAAYIPFQLLAFAHDRIALIFSLIVPNVEYIAICHAIIKDSKLPATGIMEDLTKMAECKG